MEIHFFWSWKSHGKSLLKKSGHPDLLAGCAHFKCWYLSYLGWNRLTR